MKHWKNLLLAALASMLAMSALTGCNPAANEAEDVADAQKEVQEEKADLAKED